MNTTMTIKQVADMYNVSTKTIKRKIEKLKLDIDTSSLLYPKDLCKILDVLGQPEDLAERRQSSLTLPPVIKKITTILVLILMLALPNKGAAQIIYATGETPPDPFGSLIKIDLGNCTYCRVSFISDGNDFDLTLLPNGNVVNASGISITVFDPPSQNPIVFLNISPQAAVGNILNPAGNVYVATQQGLGEFNPVTNQFTYIGNWPAALLPVVQMELWYQGGQLYGYFGFPVQQIVQIDVSNPANSIIVGSINNPSIPLQSACNIGGTVYVANYNIIYQLDPVTGNLNTVCDFSNTTIAIFGISSVPSGFPNYPCLCTTNAGTLPTQALQNVCINTPLNFPNVLGVFLDNNDLLRYVMFSNPSDTAGSIVGTSATPSFVFDPATMQTGITYYVAAMAGDNLNGNVDLDDPCLDFSNARQIIWRPTPAVVFSIANQDVCVGNCVTLDVALTGTTPFTLMYNTPYAMGQTQAFNSNTGTLTVCVPAGAGLSQAQVQATGLVDAWCGCQ
jgi:hypothetical protein